MSLPAFDRSAMTTLPASASRLDLVPRHGAILADEANETAPVRLDLVPESSLQPRDRPRPLIVARGVGAAVVVHAAFAVLFVLLLNWRELAASPEDAIPVEIVSQMPGEAGPASSKTSQTGAPQPQAEAGAPPAPAASAQPKSEPPRLVAPPPEAARAATQSETNRIANLEPVKPTPVQPPATPAPLEAPKVVTSSEGSVTVPAPATAKPDPAPVAKSTPSPSKPDPAAQLAAALPMDFTNLPTSFRSVLSGGGSSTGDEYKGLVFGKLGRSQGAAERARANHLRGQVMVSFTVDDGGRIGNLQVAQSSGSAAVDTAALDMVREAAPFPPPPPGGQRNFSPVLSFGEE